MARHWATGSDDNSQLNSDAEGFGIPVTVKPSAEDNCEVWEENWDATSIFLRCCTQWNVEMGCYLGLKYEVVFKLLDLYSIKDQAEVFESIQVIESEALTLLNKGD